MDDTRPATIGDLKRLEQTMLQGFDGMNGRFEHMDKRFERMNEHIDNVLNILVNTDIKVKDHEKRITRLEKVAA